MKLNIRFKNPNHKQRMYANVLDYATTYFGDFAFFEIRFISNNQVIHDYISLNDILSIREIPEREEDENEGEA